MMVRAAKILGIPIITTEHTIKVMGETHIQLKKHFDDKTAVVPKT